MKRVYRLHVILMQVDLDDKDPSILHDSEILEEEELAGYRDDFDKEDEAREVFSAFTRVDVRRQHIMIPVPTESYQKLLDWAKNKDKTEEDIFRYFADVDTRAFFDMTYAEMGETLLEGHKVDRAQVMLYWEEADEDQRNFYKTNMEKFWS